MTLIRWDPFRNVSTLQDRINRLFEESFVQGKEGETVAACHWRPVVDIYDTEQGLVIKAELPGVKKQDVSLEIKDNILTLKGQRSRQEDVAEENYYRRERICGTFQRSFALQEHIRPEKIKARFKDGILEVLVPKPDTETPKQVTVKIE
jgi:HSP20 family protein